MITPALDMQAAPQMVDGVRSQAAQSGASGDSEGFGAAFTASLSSSSPTTYSSDSGTAGTQRSTRQDPAGARNTSDRPISAQKSTVSASNSATNVKVPIRATALTLLNAGLKDSSADALSEALVSVASKTAAASANVSGGKAANGATSKTSVPVALAADPSLSSQSKEAVVAEKSSTVPVSNLAELQASLVSASRPLSSELSETSKTATAGKASEVAAKSKATTHDSQAAAGIVTGDVLLASLGTSAPVLTASSIVTTATSTKGTSDEVVNGSKAQFALAGQNPEALATGLSVTGAAAEKSNLATVWNSVAIETPSRRDSSTTEAASGTAHSELVHAVELSGSSLGTASAPSTGVGTPSIDRLSNSPVDWPTSPVATAVVQSSEAATPSVSAGQPIIAGAHPDINALSASVVPASPGHTTGSATSIATDQLLSSIASEPQSADAESRASRSINSVGQAKSTTAGVLASATHSTAATAQSALTRAIGLTAASASTVQSDAKAAPTENQLEEVATPAIASAPAPASIKQPSAQTERTSSSPSSPTAAGTASVASSHRGSLDTSSTTPDRSFGSDVTSNVGPVHADSSAAVVASHSAQPPAIDVANNLTISAANLIATAAHQAPLSANLTTSTAIEAVGASALQGAGTEALHGAAALDGAISSQPHQTLAATPTSLEVGVHSGTQGWLKIRAEVGDQGDVTASLASGSTSGQQILKGQLPALNAYLQSEQMSVTTSVAERIGATHGAVAHEASLGSMSAGTGSAGQDTSLLQSGAGHGAFSQGGGQQGSSIDAIPEVKDSGREDAPQTYASRVEASGSTSTSTAVNGSGRWLNVRV